MQQLLDGPASLDTSRSTVLSNRAGHKGDSLVAAWRVASFIFPFFMLLKPPAVFARLRVSVTVKNTGRTVNNFMEWKLYLPPNPQEEIWQDVNYKPDQQITVLNARCTRCFCSPLESSTGLSKQPFDQQLPTRCSHICKTWFIYLFVATIKPCTNKNSTIDKVARLRSSLKNEGQTCWFPSGGGLQSRF